MEQLLSRHPGVPIQLTQAPVSNNGGIRLKYERLDKMRIFETQSGLTRLLIYLLYEGSSNVTRAIDEANIYQHQMFPSIRKATEAGLITSDFDSESPYRARKLAVTDKGKYIAKRLDEIDIALASK